MLVIAFRKISDVDLVFVQIVLEVAKDILRLQGHLDEARLRQRYEENAVRVRPRADGLDVFGHLRLEHEVASFRVDLDPLFLSKYDSSIGHLIFAFEVHFRLGYDEVDKVSRLLD